MKNSSSTSNPEWNIEMGDYISQANDYAKMHRSIMNRIKKMRRIAKFFSIGLLLTFMVIILSIISNI